MRVAAAACNAADQFQASLVWQGARPGFAFTTGQHGTGYYKDVPPQPAAEAAPAAQPAATKPQAPAAAAAPAPQPAKAPAVTAAGKPAAARPSSSTASGAQSQAGSAAAAAGAAAASRAAQQQRQQPQQQPAPAKRQVQLPAVKVAAPVPQLRDQGQEVRWDNMLQRSVRRSGHCTLHRCLRACH